MSQRKVQGQMPAEQRAKQFLPFSALPGLEEALQEKEETVADEEAQRTAGTVPLRPYESLDESV